MANTIDIQKIIQGLDALYAKGRENEAQSYLEAHLAQSRLLYYWQGELSILNELLGQYRRSMSEEKGLAAVDAVLEIIEARRIGHTLSAATIMLNAATTLKCFGRADRAMDIFPRVERVYKRELSPRDMNMAGLYNNMALACADIGEHKKAEDCFLKALEISRQNPDKENECAVTCCNIAELYHKLDPLDEKVDEYMEKAWDYLNTPSLPHDGYHAFNISKCAPSFEYFGWFLYAKELRERAEKIYAGT